jgi:hypothetical protein
VTASEKKQPAAASATAAAADEASQYNIELINRLTDEQFVAKFSHLSGSTRWTQEMLKRRPYARFVLSASS